MKEKTLKYGLRQQVLEQSRPLPKLLLLPLVHPQSSLRLIGSLWFQPRCFRVYFPFLYRLRDYLK